jgi:hypothetical protein
MRTHIALALVPALALAIGLGARDAAAVDRVAQSRGLGVKLPR